MIFLRQDREVAHARQQLLKKLDAMPSSTGSPLIANRTGFPVAARIARIAGPLDTMRSADTLRSSGSIARSRAGSPGA
jgi:hypothetical protein